jgi:hypothetical protein
MFFGQFVLKWVWQSEYDNVPFACFVDKTLTIVRVCSKAPIGDGRKSLADHVFQIYGTVEVRKWSDDLK